VDALLRLTHGGARRASVALRFELSRRFVVGAEGDDAFAAGAFEAFAVGPPEELRAGGGQGDRGRRGFEEADLGRAGESAVDQVFGGFGVDPAFARLVDGEHVALDEFGFGAAGRAHRDGFAAAPVFDSGAGRPSLELEARRFQGDFAGGVEEADRRRAAEAAVDAVCRGFGVDPPLGRAAEGLADFERAAVDEFGGRFAVRRGEVDRAFAARARHPVAVRPTGELIARGGERHRAFEFGRLDAAGGAAVDLVFRGLAVDPALAAAGLVDGEEVGSGRRARVLDDRAGVVARCGVASTRSVALSPVAS
jgi:hypothetical protein